MIPIDSKGGDTRSEPSTEQKAEAAELAAKVAALPQGTVAQYGWPWWLFHTAFCLVTLALATFALLRIFYHDGTHYLTWINAFTRYVYLPAYVCLIWSLWQRRWVLAFASLVVIGCHVTWMAPNFMRDSRFDISPSAAAALANESDTVRIFFANVYTTNPDVTQLWDEISKADPDVVVLAECSRASRKSFQQSPLMDAYVNANGPLNSQRGEVLIFSRLPIKSEKQDYFVGRIIQTVDIELGTQTLRLIGLHAPRPMRPPAYDYFGYWKNVVPLLTSEKGPLVIVGDFNATEHSLVYKQLKESGLRSAHDDRGRGYATTWPNEYWLVPPIRIDQAFLSPEVECVNITEGRGHGSDHKPIIVDVKIRTAKAQESIAVDAETQ